ncbi:MAG: hypothetical protein ABI707_03460 [Ferruginibacter sp.]
MKIEQLIVQYLYLNKQLTLQGIGTFKLDPSVILPAGNEKEKDFVMPENAFQFEYNLKAGEDEGLVKYIVLHTRKILPLASSDLESYAMLAKQFLNIGKPLVIEGVGTIQKNQQGNYQFIPGVFITPKIDDIPKQIREKRDESVSFESEAKVNNSRRNLMVFITVLVIILVGLGIYYVLMNRKTNEPEQSPQQAESITDTTRKDTSIKTIIDTGVTIAAPIIKTEGSTFNIVLKSYPTSEAAQRALRKLRAYGHKLVVLTDDSLNYELAMPFNTPLSDTLRTKDSLQKFFGGSPYVKF